MQEVVALMDVPDGVLMLLQNLQIVGSIQSNVLGEEENELYKNSWEKTSGLFLCRPIYILFLRRLKGDLALYSFCY